MVRSPNDMDPPDYVEGNPPLEALYEAIYEKFPWLEDVEEALGLLDLSERIRAPGVDELLKFVIEKAHDAGVADAQRDIGEYIDHLEGKIIDLAAVSIESQTSPSTLLALEQQNIILKNQRDRMVDMYHGVEEAPAPQTDEEWLVWKRNTPASGQGD